MSQEKLTSSRVKFYRLSGELLLPKKRFADSKGRFQVVILLSGWRGTKDSPRSVGIAEQLQRAGIASFRFDFSGHGKSPGDIRLASVHSEVQELKYAIGMLLCHEHINLSKGFGIVGASIGGSVALAYAGLVDKIPSLRALVLVSPRSDFHRNLRQGTYSYTDQKSGEKIVNLVMMKSGRMHDFYSLAGKVTQPVLVIHGEKDQTVPISQSKKLLKGRTNFRLKVVPGGDHVLRDPFNDKVVEWANKFLIQQLKPSHKRH